MEEVLIIKALEDNTWEGKTMDHITDTNTRRVLLGELTDIDSLCEALVYAEDCCEADANNPDVSLEVLSKREAYLEAADHAQKLGEYDVAVRHLRNFWFT